MLLETTARGMLLGLARESIVRRLRGDGSLPQPGRHRPELEAIRATFVTLTLDGALRGCIGTLEAQRPLWLDVTHNARAAAFRDPRFPPLGPAELDSLHIEVSVLSPPEAMPAPDRASLLAALRPGQDGLIVEEGTRRATYLPAVWESLPGPEDFLAQLLLKAGLPRDHWSPRLRFFRYGTESFEEGG